MVLGRIFEHEEIQASMKDVVQSVEHHQAYWITGHEYNWNHQ